MIIVSDWKKQALSMMADKKYREFQKKNYSHGLNLTACMNDFKSLYNALTKKSVIQLDPVKHEFALEELMKDIMDYIYYSDGYP